MDEIRRPPYRHPMADVVEVLSKLALSLPDVEEKVACAGTAIEQASFHTNRKSFLFAQRKGDGAIIRLKLDHSLAEARAAGGGVEVGKNNWTTCRIPLAKAPSATLKRWVRESYAMSAKPKSSSKKKTAKKAASKKKAAKKTGKKKVASKKKTTKKTTTKKTTSKKKAPARKRR